MSTNWHLDKLIESLGSSRFEGALVDSMQALTGVDHCNLVQFPRQPNRPQTLLTAGRIRAGLARDCVEIYDDHLYQQDPVFNKVKNGVDSHILQTKIDNYKNRNYRELLLSRCGIAEKLSLIKVGADASYCLNLYRFTSSQPYEPTTIRQLTEVDQIIGAVLERHAQLISRSNQRFEFEWILERLTLSCCSILSRREMEICARIVLGCTSETIASELKISANTVLTHRKRAYEKLGISTQNQLFAIVLEGKTPNPLH